MINIFLNKIQNRERIKIGLEKIKLNSNLFFFVKWNWKHKITKAELSQLEKSLKYPFEVSSRLSYKRIQMCLAQCFKCVKSLNLSSEMVDYRVLHN